MAMFREDTDYREVRMVQKVVDLFESHPPVRRIVNFALHGVDMENYLGEDDFENGFWIDRQHRFHGFPGFSENINRRLIGNPSRSSNSVFLPPSHSFTLQSTHKPNLPSEPVESHAERTARLLQEVKKSKEKTEKKRLKKQKQKERKRLEKEKQNPQSAEEKDDSQQSKAEESQRDKSTKDDTNSSVQHLTSSRDIDSSDSSEEETSEEGSEPGSESGDFEELDLTSTFVSKAALIAKRKLEQKPRPERREQKKNPVKEETRQATDKLNEDQNNGKKNTTTPNTLTLEDNLRISTELAVLGNKFASTGQFDVAVKYFTDAIKYNPTEFKLFGNRSFCFEKMQEYEKSLTDAELSLIMFPDWVKGLYRKGRALAGLKRYDEAAQAFKQVLKLDSSCTDAAQELMRVQIIQVMEHGFSREQSSNALIIHGTVNKALEVLYKLNSRPVENINRTSPLPSASPNPHPPPQAQDAPFMNGPLGPVQNMSNVQSQSKPISNRAVKTNDEDRQSAKVSLFPIWVGNMVSTVTEAMITNLFSRVGAIYSVKLLTARRCAFVNFTTQEHCDEAIRQFNGYDLMGTKIVVRYPDRIPQGMGMSRSALKADDLQDENIRQNERFNWRNTGCSQRPSRPYRYLPDHRGIHKQ